MPDQSLRFTARAILCVACCMASIPGLAADPEFSLLITGHRFEPTELRVPANTRVKLSVQNQDPTPEEFESHALNREKLIPAGSKVVIYIGPLKPGRYEYFGEFNPTSAKGVILAE